jgi:hypothetical protein
LQLYDFETLSFDGTDDAVLVVYAVCRSTQFKVAKFGWFMRSTHYRTPGAFIFATNEMPLSADVEAAVAAVEPEHGMLNNSGLIHRRNTWKRSVAPFKYVFSMIIAQID